MPAAAAFTADALARFEGPDWLQRRRHDALDRFLAAELPTEALEVWRYSRISQLDLDAYTPDPAWAPTFELPPAAVAAGVTVAFASELDEGDDVVGSVAGSPTDAFGDLAMAFSADPLVVRVPAGATIAEPVRVRWHAAVAGTAVFPRIVVQVGENAEATVVEEATSADVAAFAAPVVELDVAAGARLRYVGLQQLGQQVWQVGYQASTTANDASLRSLVVALGGSYARVRTDARLAGRGAYNELLAVYFGEADQMHDFRTMQDHAAPDTTSELFFKGAVDGASQSVYTGLIRVRKEAVRTNAFQTNRNLVLSDAAGAESVPNLEIETNDVRCSHASAVGPIDDDQRFYVESRGVPPEVAERLIVLGFFEEIVERVPVPELATDLRRALAAKFARGRS